MMKDVYVFLPKAGNCLSGYHWMEKS